MGFSRIRPVLLWTVSGSFGLSGLLAAQTTAPTLPRVASPRTEVSQGAVPKPTALAALKVDPSASKIYVKVGAEGYGHIHGVSGRLSSGTVGLGGGGELVFDMTTFSADSAEVRQMLGLTKAVSAADRQKVTARMLGAEVLDVARYPRAVFTIAAATPLDGQIVGAPGRYQLQGEFFLHGVRRPLLLNASVEPTETPSLFRMRGAFAILQSEYGITPYSALGGLVGVTDKLEISGDLMLGERNP